MRDDLLLFSDFFFFKVDFRNELGQVEVVLTLANLFQRSIQLRFIITIYIHSSLFLLFLFLFILILFFF